MKTILATGILLLIMLSGVSAQSSASEISKEFYKSDANLSIAIHYIPQGWSLKAVDDKFIITATDTVWVLAENRLNVKSENREDLIKRIKAYGIRTVPEIILRYEGKWSPDKIQAAKIKNSELTDEMSKLPAKYNIAGLLDKSLSSKDQKVYIGRNDKEKRLIQQYEDEKKVLLAKQIVLPDYHSEKYSLFIVSTRGNNDDMHIAYPDKGSLELYTILNTFREICGK